MTQTFAGTTVNTDGPTASTFSLTPINLAGDSVGNYYYGDQGNCIIRRINSTNYVKTLVGTGICGTDSFGAGTSLKIGRVGRLGLDSIGNLYFTDIENNLIRKLVPSTGIIT